MVDCPDPSPGEDVAPVDLEPGDVIAFARAAEKLRANPSEVERPELSFFRDLLHAWHAKVGAAPKGGATRGASDGDLDDAVLTRAASCEAIASKPAPVLEVPETSAPAPAADVMELDSDEDGDVLHAKEMELPAGLLERELEDEQDTSIAPGEKPSPDLERLEKDSGPFPLLPPRAFGEPSDARKKLLGDVKRQATEALTSGNVRRALDRYTEVMRTGGATAYMLATRAALLMKQKRPCAAIRDCCAALQINSACGKAYHIRGVAHRKLGHWKKAHRDLSEGQRLDFSEDSVNVHMFVANKVGLMQDLKTGRWFSKEGAKKAVELLFDDTSKQKPSGPDLRPGQAVRIYGLTKAPHLNSRRAIVQKPSPKGDGRWEVEIRLDRGLVDVKSIRGENIMIVRAAEADAWKEEERRHAEDCRKREKEEKRWLGDDEQRKRMEEKRKATERSLAATGFPDMDASERLEAEMSTMTLAEEAMQLLRRLRPEEALDILQKLSLGSIGDQSGFIKIKVKQKLGEPDSEEEPVQPRHMQRQASNPAPGAARAPQAAQAVEADEAEDSEDEDFDRLPEDTGPVLDQGYYEEDPSQRQADMLEAWRKSAASAADRGDFDAALRRYTDVIRGGGASALALAKRAEVLLKLRRPCAAIRDCSTALEKNVDLGKAYRVRGIAYRKLGHWQEAHRDLQAGQRLDFDEGTSNVQKFVAERVRREEQRASAQAHKRRRKA